jgi:thioredoxin 1
MRMKWITVVTIAAAMAVMICSAVAQRAAIYSNEDAKPAVRAALAEAARTHKRVILDFGGNWCPDCLALDYYIHQAPNAELAAKNFVIVHVNIGQYDMNLDVAKKYDIPLQKGVPALVVLDAQGRILVAQRNQEFEKMSRMQSASVTEFLMQWKPPAK